MINRVPKGERPSALTKTHPGGMGRYAAAPGGTHIQWVAMVLSMCQNMYQAVWTNFRYRAGGHLLGNNTLNYAYVTGGVFDDNTSIYAQNESHTCQL